VKPLSHKTTMSQRLYSVLKTCHVAHSVLTAIIAFIFFVNLFSSRSAQGELLWPAFVLRPSLCVVRRASSVNLFYLNIFSSETAHWILTKLHRNTPWVVPYQRCSNGFDWLYEKIGFQMLFSKIFLSETTKSRAFICGV